MPKKPVKKRAKLSIEERRKKQVEQQFKIRINTLFRNSGFEQIPTRDKHFEFESRMGEIDNIFLYENIIVITEDTCINSQKVRDHINKTAIFFRHIKNNETEFIKFIETKFNEFSEKKSHLYSSEDFKFVYLYCSLNKIAEHHKSPHTFIKFLNNTSIKYFEALTKTIHKSAKFEIFKFLDLKLSDIKLTHGTDAKEYSGFVLPEGSSGFSSQHKVVTFYIDPKSLIELCYVLRKDSWLDKEGLYQRMLIKNKIRSMREYLASEDRVFINNVVVSLPSDIKYLDEHGNTVEPSQIKKTKGLKVKLPTEFNSIGLIDGQHRVFCYHEGRDKFEENIQAKRLKQHLLVTGVVFPEGIDDQEKMKFEARLFLEINDKQSRAKGDLKQAIQTIVDPFSSVALAKSVIEAMADHGPLEGLLEDHYFGDGKIKTTSIVSYGLRHIVAIDDINANHSLHKLWQNGQRGKLGIASNSSLRKDYVDFCTTEINNYILGYKFKMMEDGFWTTNKKESSALTITAINGLIFCFKRLIEEGATGDIDYYHGAFNKLKLKLVPGGFPYKSSSWRGLGTKIYDECFSVT